MLPFPERKGRKSKVGHVIIIIRPCTTKEESKPKTSLVNLLANNVKKMENKLDINLFVTFYSN